MSQKDLTKTTSKKNPVSFYIIMILIPIIFILLLEGGLRLFGYGENLKTFIKVSPNYYGLNFDIAKRYFHGTKALPNSIQDVFRVNKAPNGFRVFVLGGSSGAGYPYMPMGSFSRYLRKRLEMVYPNNVIEVVNLSLTAVNTYTVADILPDVLEQEPDLILIYAGHNEYYGALGVGSLMSLGNSPAIVRLNLSLQHFKTYQLVRNLIGFTTKQFSSEPKATSGTLMSRMAKEKEIPFGSELYNAGLEQFRSNLDLILSQIKEKDVPVLISTLASNLKDQPPFISKASGENPVASEIYKEAQNQLSTGQLKMAEKLFRKAKDLDMLRFRAPEEINKIIKEVARSNKVYSVDGDKLFANNSPNGITGNNLMTDHLHPTLEGYQLLGEMFYKEMVRRNILPDGETSGLPIQIQHRITLDEFAFSRLDSTIAEYKLKLLLDDFPFRKDGKITPTLELLSPKDFIDTTAMKFVLGKITWDRAQTDAAAWYFQNDDLNNFVNQRYVFLTQFPLLANEIQQTAQLLLEKKKFMDAYNFLQIKYKFSPDAFTTKWLGIIDLSRNRNNHAIKFLGESLDKNPKDYQVLYNIAGAFSKKAKYDTAIGFIDRALLIQPNNLQAQSLRNQLLYAREHAPEPQKPRAVIKIKP